MIYTAVFQDEEERFIFETHVGAHDRSVAWKEAYDNRGNEKSCLVLLIDGQANIRTFNDVVDIS